jgi:hypothetical protein
LGSAYVSTEDDIRAFWDWFASTREQISQNPTDDAVIEELNRRVFALGCPAWEIGPGDQTDWFLALSPDGDPDSLALTREIVHEAPNLPGWEILPYRPRKKWELQFEFEGASGPIQVDARGWRFVAYRYPDGVYDLVVLVPEEPSLAPPDRDLAARIAVEGQLGEQALLTAVNEIQPVVELPDADIGRSQPLSALVVLPENPPT